MKFDAIVEYVEQHVPRHCGEYKIGICSSWFEKRITFLGDDGYATRYVGHLDVQTCKFHFGFYSLVSMKLKLAFMGVNNLFIDETENARLDSEIDWAKQRADKLAEEII